MENSRIVLQSNIYDASVPNATVYNWVVPANTNIKSGQGTEQIELFFCQGLHQEPLA